MSRLSPMKRTVMLARTEKKTFSLDRGKSAGRMKTVDMMLMSIMPRRSQAITLADRMDLREIARSMISLYQRCIYIVTSLVEK